MGALGKMRGPLLLVSSVLSAGFVLASLFLLALQLLPLLLVLHQKHTLLPLSPTPGFPSLKLAAGVLIVVSLLPPPVPLQAPSFSILVLLLQLPLAAFVQQPPSVPVSPVLPLGFLCFC